MKVINFPIRPSGDIRELWDSTIDLARQLDDFLSSTLKNVVIHTTETQIAHGKKWTPSIAIPIRITNVAVWQSRPPDSKYCYFTATTECVVDLRVFP
jgi:hypothetical protein